MIKTSDAYKEAVTADARRVRVRVPLRVCDPELQYGALTASSEAPVSQLGQVLDKELELRDKYASLEDGRWTLDGSMDILPDDYSYPGQVGYVSGEICGEDSTFPTPQTVTLNISGVSILQVVTITFPDNAWDGVPEDFTINIIQGGTVYHTETVTGNTEHRIRVQGFTVYVPDAVELTITKWSIPFRRARLVELFPGYSENWTENNISALSIKMQASVNAMSTPYGTASVTLDNLDRLFDPRNKSGLFLSLEERQPVPIELGVDLPDGTPEWVPCGTYYQQDGAWQTGDDGLTMRWDLVDIIGLLVGRTFIVPDSFPSTLEGWIAELVSQLGTAFVGHYTVDPDYADMEISPGVVDDSLIPSDNSEAIIEAISGKDCGDILKWLCQASGTFARADSKTGYLAVEPLWNQGNEYKLDNLQARPAMSANDNLAYLLFKFNMDYIVSGNLATSSNNITIDNPFILNTTQALMAARNILTSYGGNKISTTGRGDPSSEIGDVVTVQLDKSMATSARLLSQTFEFSDHVLTSCKSEMLQANGGFLYANVEVITEDCVWTAPAGVTELEVILIGGGQGGGIGIIGGEPNPGTTGWGSPGKWGINGTGGKVWSSRIGINDSQQFEIHIGEGGPMGIGSNVLDPFAPIDGGDTTFGTHSSANGRVYTPAWTDITSGSVYARTGIFEPVPGTGDGGHGGTPGKPGYEEWVRKTDEFGNELPSYILKDYILSEPGGNGAPGASGCVIIYWDKEEST